MVVTVPLAYALAGSLGIAGAGTYLYTYLILVDQEYKNVFGRHLPKKYFLNPLKWREIWREIDKAKKLEELATEPYRM